MEAKDKQITPQHNTQQLFEHLAADGLSQADIDKLKLLIPETRGNSAYLSQAFGLSSEDSDKLALGILYFMSSFSPASDLTLKAIKLLSSLPIPSKLLNIRPNLKSANSLKSNSTLPLPTKPQSTIPLNPVIPSFPSYPPTPFSMYPYHQNPFTPAPTPSSSSTSKLPTTGQSQTTLYVRNLPSTAKEEEILAVFQNFGVVKEARFQKSKETHEFFGYDDRFYL